MKNADGNETVVVDAEVGEIAETSGGGADSRTLESRRRSASGIESLGGVVGSVCLLSFICN
jgi:hypothetical protein